MGTTPILSIPYVEPTDGVAAYPAAMKAMADRIEAMITAPFRISLANPWLTPAAGWSFTTNTLAKFSNGLRIFTLSFTRTGANIAIPVTGDMGNQAIGSFATTGIGNYGPVSVFGNGRLAGFSLGGGSVSLTAVTPGGDIATNDQLSAIGLFFGGE